MRTKKLDLETELTNHRWKGRDLPRVLLEAAREHPACPRLHIVVPRLTQDSVWTLCGTRQLSTLAVARSVGFRPLLESPSISQQLEAVLLANPGLERLELTLSSPESDQDHIPEDYLFMLNLKAGERITPLREFAVSSYLNSQLDWSPYDMDRLVRRLDWSQLLVLTTEYVTIATALVPHCPRLNHLTLRKFRPKDMARTIRLCRSLVRLDWSPYLRSRWEPRISEALACHKHSLKSLSIQRCMPGTGEPLGLDKYCTEQLCAAIPNVEFLAIAMYRDGSWVGFPYVPFIYVLT